eukprot:TRINITY_DN8866_c0_g1_i2.p1 TRINITY_DN8866_c0_g1~~TRINITY_DN8866_c0_g1_i2.p1  ORF type:complete len:301 (-),score=99.53 TRINITY_DN8866_c0_g1_i2:114-977(-)
MRVVEWRREEQKGPEGLPRPLSPIVDFKIHDIEFVEMQNEKEALEAELRSSKCHMCPKLNQHHAEMHYRRRLESTIQEVQYRLSDAHLRYMPEFMKRLNVLQQLGFIDADHTVALKGRVSRELNTVKDELLATELIFDNYLTKLSPEEAVALLSCLLFEEKVDVEPTLPESLNEAREQITELAINIARVQVENGLDIEPQEYARKLNFGLAEVVYEWAQGMPFSDICTLTNVLEGSIVRNIVRLDETCREVRNAARIVGDTALYEKMTAASEKIKRDIVFASSLYVR